MKKKVQNKQTILKLLYRAKRLLIQIYFRMKKTTIKYLRLALRSRTLSCLTKWTLLEMILDTVLLVPSNKLSTLTEEVYLNDI